MDLTSPPATPSRPVVEVREHRYDDDVVQRLVDQIQAEYVARYGGPDETPLDPDEFAAPTGAFLVAYADEDVVGCGGLRRHDDTRVELKRMFVRTPFRGRGLSRSLLGGLEQVAVQLGYREVIAETGLAQPEAVALYASSGYRRIAAFGYYRDSGRTRCYAKALSSLLPAEPTAQ